MKIIIVGVGGTGSAIATMLSRMYDNCEIILVDNDKVEKSNVKRQAYQLHDVGEYKAESLAIKLNSSGNQSNKHYAYNKYLTSVEDLSKICYKFLDLFSGSEIILIGCVDNHPARMIMEKWVKNKTPCDIIYIDSANEEWNGEIVKVKVPNYLRVRDGLHIIFGKLRSDRFKGLKRIKKGDRSKQKCGVVIDSGGIQQYSTNSMAANIIMQMLENKDETGICYFDTKKLVMQYVKD